MKGETTASWLKFYGPIILVVFITIGWGAFFHYVSPTALVAKIGIQNSYLVAFLISSICGFSSLTGTTFYITIAALVKGGANPLYIGLTGGLGVCLSDFAFYFLVSKGTHVIDKHWSKFVAFTEKWTSKKPEWILYAFVFLYSGFFPLPNDILLVALAFSKIPYKKIAPYLIAGDFVSTLIIAYFFH